jgi:hypothetical protein
MRMRRPRKELFAYVQPREIECGILWRTPV